jgi:SPP1 gp7 family putative phage head morphogenesis protein
MKTLALGAVEIELLDRGLPAIIDKAYTRGMFDLQQQVGIGFSFAALDEKRIQEVLKTAWSGAHYSKRVWKNVDLVAQTVEETVAAGFRSGQSIRRMAKEIQDKFEVSKHVATRLVRTETNALANMVEMKAYEEAHIEKYRFQAVLDGRTSEVCRDHDGMVYMVSEARQGYNMPPLHPNCRSGTVAFFDDQDLSRLQRRARDPETGETYLIPRSMTYREWEEKYVKKGAPAFKSSELLRSTTATYTPEELLQMGKDSKELLDGYVKTPSKWNERIVENHPTVDYGKLWNCSIAVRPNMAPHIMNHEMLHSKSASYYDQATYVDHRIMEEAAVELLNEEIGRFEGVRAVLSQYAESVAVLRMINALCKIAKTDFEFAKQFFEVPLPERGAWLNDISRGIIYETGTFQDMAELNDLLARLGL